ncbi:MAG TPA: SRPBCC family protein, partial [Acidobacteriota bacterium]|nr:SRPBCC family protein [Acidobacteriota bacterium]
MRLRYAAREERAPTTASRPRSRSGSRVSVPDNKGVKVVRAVTIRRPAAELYEFWRNVENLPRIIRHSVTIAARSPTESHWSVSGPGGKCYEWDSLVINDEPGRLIAWRTADGADIAHAGSIRFEDAPGDEGTEVTVQVEYIAPGGKLGQLLGKLTGAEPGQQVGDTLRRFKALMECGEIPTTNGQPVGEPQKSKRDESARKGEEQPS